MENYFFKLKFLSSVHFGERSGYLETVNETVGSDTLFSALINIVSIYFGKEEADRWIEDFKVTPPFLLSSLFIYNQDRYFLPKPLYDSFIESSTKSAVGKEIKKIKWLTWEDFIKWCSGYSFTEKEVLELKHKLIYYETAFLYEVRPRVTLDRVTSQSSLYFVGNIKYADDAGLYGFVKFNNRAYIEKFHRALSLLGETGIGGEKTYGFGMFQIVEFREASEFKEISNKDFEYFTLLSLYHPSKDEFPVLKESLIGYDIKRKTGYINSGRYAMPFKRKSVGFLMEGSVLRKPLVGSLVDVTPEGLSKDAISHRVYRYGYAFLFP